MLSFQCKVRILFLVLKDQKNSKFAKFINFLYEFLILVKVLKKNFSKNSAKKISAYYFFEKFSFKSPAHGGYT